MTGRSDNERWQIGRQGNYDGVDWDRLNHGVDHCRRERPGCRLDCLNLGDETERLSAPSPSDGWHSQIVRTSGLRWGYFVKQWGPWAIGQCDANGHELQMSCSNSCTAKDAVVIWVQSISK